MSTVLIEERDKGNNEIVSNFMEWKLDHLVCGIVKNPEMDDLVPWLTRRETQKNQVTWFNAIRDSLDKPCGLLTKDQNVGAGWVNFETLMKELNQEIGNTLKDGQSNLNPDANRLWVWTRPFPIEQVRVVFLGYDPAPKNRSSGFSFHPPSNETPSKSVRKLLEGIEKNEELKEKRELMKVEANDYSLEGWIKQGVLLLNCCTSIDVRGKEHEKTKADDRNSVIKKKRSKMDPAAVQYLSMNYERDTHPQWITITRAVLDYIYTNFKNVVFIFAGTQVRHRVVDGFFDTLEGFKDNDRFIETDHPSFRDISNCLLKCNDVLKKLDPNSKPIDWLKLDRWSWTIAPLVSPVVPPPPVTGAVCVSEKMQMDDNQIQYKVLDLTKMQKSWNVAMKAAYRNPSWYTFLTKNYRHEAGSQDLDTDLKMLDEELSKNNSNIVITTNGKFEWTHYVPFHMIKVLIVVHDPSESTGSGLAFHPPDPVNLDTVSETTRQIFDQIANEFKLTQPANLPNKNYSFQRWFDQGVLMINTAISKTDPMTQPGILNGWIPIMKHLLHYLFEKNEDAVFMFVGKVAQRQFQAYQVAGGLESKDPSRSYSRVVTVDCKNLFVGGLRQVNEKLGGRPRKYQIKWEDLAMWSSTNDQ